MSTNKHVKSTLAFKFEYSSLGRSEVLHQIPNSRDKIQNQRYYCVNHWHALKCVSMHVNDTNRVGVKAKLSTVILS